MALADYILCAKCNQKLVYYDSDNTILAYCSDCWTTMQKRLKAAELCAEHGKLLSAYLSKKDLDPFEQGSIEVWERRCEAWRKAAGR